MHTLRKRSPVPKRSTLNRRLKDARFFPEEIYIITQLWSTRFFRKQKRYKIYFAPNPQQQPDYEYYDYMIGHPEEGATIIDAEAVRRLISLGILVFEMSDYEYEVQCSLGIDPPRFLILSSKWCRYGLVRSKYKHKERLR